MKEYQFVMKEYQHISLIWKIPYWYVRKYQYDMAIREKNWYAKISDWWSVLV